MDKVVLEVKIVEVIKIVYDLEILVDIYELGLIYSIDISDQGIVNLCMMFIIFMCLVVDFLFMEV